MQAYLTLHKTYYDQGFWNIPVDFDRFVRRDEGPITLVLGKGKQEIKAHVNRSANQNGTARIMGRGALRDWFHKNYKQGDKIPMSFATPNRIVLGMQTKDNSLNEQFLRVKITEDGLTIPKWLLPNVEEVDIRKRNGVIEVAPVDKDEHFALTEFGTKARGNRQGIPEDDPIMQMGRNPVYDPEITDGSINHDKYIYGV